MLRLSLAVALALALTPTLTLTQVPPDEDELPAVGVSVAVNRNLRRKLYQQHYLSNRFTGSNIAQRVEREYQACNRMNTPRNRMSTPCHREPAPYPRTGPKVTQYHRHKLRRLTLTQP